jgi:formate/nitrite transporter FocA (FNT family)
VTSAVLHNIAIATISNLVGGSVMVGVVYWFVYCAVEPTLSVAECDAEEL